MGLGNLTRQLAQQAIGDKVKDMMDSLRPPDLASISEASATKPSPSAPADNTGAVIIGQIQAMQNALKEDQELVVLCETGVDMVRVLEIFVPSWRVFVLTGIDPDKAITRIIAPVDSVKLVCKPMSVQTSTKPTRVRFITPKPKSE